MTKPLSLWQVSLSVPLPLADVFGETLEAFCDAVSWLETADGRTADLNGYAAERPDEAGLRRAFGEAAALQGIAPPAASVVEVGARDWVAENLKSFPPIRIGRFYIHGDHVADPPPPGTLDLAIDASVAFGTGEHATTAGCLRAVGSPGWERAPRRVLDMGCGSGILALAASRLWPRAHVLGADIDPAAVRVARTHAVANGLGHRVGFMTSRGYDDRAVRRAGPYDLIFANILARPLMAMAGDAGRNLAAAGRLVLSGFLVRDENRVMAAHNRAGLYLVRRIRVNGWTTLVMARPARSR